MKATVLFLACLSAFSLFSYTSDPSGKAPEDEKSPDTLFFMGSRGALIDKEGKATLIPPEEFVFTGYDIKYYDLTTDEIVFTDSFVSDMPAFIKLISTYNIFNIYLNDKLLFKNVLEMRNSSMPVNDLVFYFDAYFTNKLYLSDVYPSCKILGCSSDSLPEWMMQEREENAEKRKAEWDIFIRYLSDAGKITGDTGTEKVKAALPVEIYSAGKTIQINNRTGKNAVVTVYRIDGVKVMEQTMTVQTTSLEIPVGGFYAVSVKAGNEKPVTAKLIIKN